MEEREIKEEGIVLKTADCGEADRMITILLANTGKVVAKIKGVKKPKAKLAYASFPFNFGEYILVRTGKSYNVINCSFYDNFNELSTDLNKYYAGSGMLDIVDQLTTFGSECGGYMILLLKSLNKLCYLKDVNIIGIISKFLIDILSYSGFKIMCVDNLDTKSYCFFDFSIGRITNEFSDSAVKLTKEECDCLLDLIEKPFENINFESKFSKNILKLIVFFMEDKMDINLKIFKKFV